MSRPLPPPPAGSGELSPGELSPGERKLLARALAQRDEDGVPAATRERLLERALAEAREPERMLPRPAALVPVRSGGAVQAIVAALAMAAAVVLFARLREPRAGNVTASDAATPGNSSAARQVGSRLFQSELFRTPAAAYSGPLPAATVNLFGEVPFSRQSRAWQARRWNDLGVDPVEPAAYEHEGAALCIELGSGERVVAGWPWLPSSSAGFGPRTAELAPAPVPLEAGHRYHLVFKAWAREPVPEQLLVAVGHARVPFSGAGGARVELSTTPRAYLVEIVPRHADPSVGVAFMANAAPGSAPSRVCVSDVTLHAFDAR
jgi:hypothetical protein